MPLLTVLDIVTISIASIEVYLFEEDLIAVGTFHALSKVIIPVNAAGNTGLQPGIQTLHLSPKWFSVKALVVRIK
ncbi:hypothetical protein DY000_02017888 [Brassica cretica]|uniref:Uncharacterized protein n=1 Tax=Brassica cretica TaxID=69181 RepID=A0ABQ7D7K1_BRACR|nr:hypothetical protein DY000_02017888 [Brassica cretica]